MKKLKLNMAHGVSPVALLEPLLVPLFFLLGPPRNEIEYEVYPRVQAKR